jgi:hypothetical protein
MACHSGGWVGVDIANVLETYASFRELIQRIKEFIDTRTEF